jgi:hypothetical protein
MPRCGISSALGSTAVTGTFVSVVVIIVEGTVSAIASSVGDRNPNHSKILNPANTATDAKIVIVFFWSAFFDLLLLRAFGILIMNLFLSDNGKMEDGKVPNLQPLDARLSNSLRKIHHA